MIEAEEYEADDARALGQRDLHRRVDIEPADCVRQAGIPSCERFLVDDDEDLAGADASVPGVPRSAGGGPIARVWLPRPCAATRWSDAASGSREHRAWVACSIGSSCERRLPTSSGSLADARLAVSAATSRSRFSASAWRVMSLTVPTSSCSPPASSRIAEIERAREQVTVLVLEQHLVLAAVERFGIMSPIASNAAAASGCVSGSGQKG